MVPPCDGEPGRAEQSIGIGGKAHACKPGAGGAGVAVKEIASDAADPGDLESKSPGKQRRSGFVDVGRHAGA